MASCREILSLQLGHYSNHIGAHWWNIQESSFDYNASTPSEVNHDVLFREGQTSNRLVTFTPRLLLVDLKGSLKHMPEAGGLYDQTIASPELACWNPDKVNVVPSASETKNEFLEDIDNENAMQQDNNDRSLKVYKLDNVVNVWSDYMKTRFHPHTVTIINEYQHNSETSPFDIYNYGLEMWRNVSFQEEFTDRIRFFVEECDNMQGFQILVDGTDGFSGMGASVLEYLQEEYERKPSLVFPVIPGAFPESLPIFGCIRSINLALSFQAYKETSSLFSPLCVGGSGWRHPGEPRQFPYLHYNASLSYHTSSILASALDTATLLYRLRDHTPYSLSELCDTLGSRGHKVAACSVALPFPMKEDAFLLETLENWEGPLWYSLTPNCSLENDRIWMQSIVLRGIAGNRLRNLLFEDKYKQTSNPAYECTNIKDMLKLFLAYCSSSTLSHVTTANSACRVTAPYPQIFSDYIGIDGSVSTNKRLENMSVYSVPVMAGLHCSASVGTMLQSLHTEVKSLQLKRFHQFRTAGLEEDDYRECLEQLLQLRECYHEEFDV